LSRRKLHAGLVMVAGDDPDPALVARLRGVMDFVGPFSSCLAIGMVGYLVSGAFLSVLFYPGLALFAAIAQATAAIWRRELLTETLRARAADAPVPRQAAIALAPLWNRAPGEAEAEGAAAARGSAP